MSGHQGGQGPTLEAVRAWARAQPACTQDAIAARFRVDKVAAAGLFEALVREGVVVPPSADRSRTTTIPASELPPDIRGDARASYRAAYRLVRLTLERTLGEFEMDPTRVLTAEDQKPMAALRSLQQVATGLVDAHPGLLAVDDDTDEPGTGRTTEDDLEVVLQVLKRKGDR